MNIFLWVLQVVLALHTIMGAVWKVTNSEQSVPSLSAIPHGLWLALIVVELLLAVGLVLPVLGKSLGIFASVAAIGIAAEMLLFCVVHFSSGKGDFGQPVYWLVVAAICAFIAYGRLVLRPL